MEEKNTTPQPQQPPSPTPSQNPSAPSNTTPPPPQATTSESNQPNTPQPKKSLPKWILIALIFVIIAFLATGAYAGYTLLSTPTPTPTPTQAPREPTSTPDPTADWQVYSNEEYGFNLKHPSLDSECCSIAGPANGNGTNAIYLATLAENTFMEGTDQTFNGVSIYIQPNNNKITFEDYVTRQKELLQQFNPSSTTQEQSETPVEISGIKGVRLSGFNWDGFDRIYLPLDENNFLILGVSIATPEFEQTVNQILSTFRFTEDASILPITTPEAVPSGPVTQCTMEAKICPDGSSVGRQGPSCEFAPCPPLQNE